MADERSCLEVHSRLRDGDCLPVELIAHAKHCIHCAPMVQLESWLRDPGAEMEYDSSRLWQKIRIEQERLSSSKYREFFWPRRLVFAISFLLVLFAGILIGKWLVSEPEKGAALVVASQGDVLWQKKGQRGWEEIQPGLRLPAGSRIKVWRKARATLSFSGGSRVHILGETEVSLHVSASVTRKEKLELILPEGTLFIEHRRDYLFIATPVTTVIPIGTRFSVRHWQEKTVVAVAHGRVHLKGKSGEAFVEKGNLCEVQLHKPPARKPMRSEYLDQWTRKFLEETAPSLLYYGQKKAPKTKDDKEQIPAPKLNNKEVQEYRKPPIIKGNRSPEEREKEETNDEEASEIHKNKKLKEKEMEKWHEEMEKKLEKGAERREKENQHKKRVKGKKKQFESEENKSEEKEDHKDKRKESHEREDDQD